MPLISNKSLQRTFDPPRIFAFAKARVASSAAEFRRYVLGGNLKKMFYLLICFTVISGCSGRSKSSFSYYKSLKSESCNLVVGLSKEGDKLLYNVTTNVRSAKGTFMKRGQQIVFFGLYASESAGNSQIEVSALQQGDTLTIQNYGNGMNSFTLFSECESKYLSLVKVRT